MIPQQLFNLLCTKIIPLFKLNQNDARGQPWWWPVDKGYAFGDWFDQANNIGYQPRLFQAFNTNKPSINKRLHHSLQGRHGGQKTHNVTHHPYQSFRGFWGYSKTEYGKRIIILSDQPSQNVYPSGQTTKWMNNLNTLGLQGVHVTDFVKIRGPIQEKAQVFDKQQLNFWRNILIEELSILAEMNTESTVQLCVYANNVSVRARTYRQSINMMTVKVNSESRIKNYTQACTSTPSGGTQFVGNKLLT